MSRLRGFLLHTGVICSFVCITAKVLDWYNPYMDFTGHIWLMQLTLYFTVILLALLKRPQERAAILSSMSVANAADLTEKMKK